MVRVVSRVEVRRVTIVARRRQPLVHVVHMTLCARRSLVSSRQRKARIVVVERRRPPNCCGMAGATIMTKVPGNVVWVRRLRKLDLVALVTIVKHQLVVPVRVTALALRRDMCARQREVRCIMIERCRAPR